MKRVITIIHSHLLLAIAAVVITTSVISSQVLVTKASVEQLVVAVTK